MTIAKQVELTTFIAIHSVSYCVKTLASNKKLPAGSNAVSYLLASIGTGRGKRMLFPDECSPLKAG